MTAIGVVALHTLQEALRPIQRHLPQVGDLYLLGPFGDPDLDGLPLTDGAARHPILAVDDICEYLHTSHLVTTSAAGDGDSYLVTPRGKALMQWGWSEGNAPTSRAQSVAEGQASDG